MNKTRIDWTDLSWNVVTGCSKGCPWCYARRISKRFGRPFVPTFHEDRLAEPLKRRQPSKIFACSMGDLFDPAITYDQVDRVLAVMSITPHHVYQVLTKRPERMADYFRSRGPHGDKHTIGAEVYRLRPEAFGGGDSMEIVWPLPKLWLGTSITNQADADERIPYLLRVPAAVRWLSIEPLLGPVDLTLVPYIYTAPLHWVVIGAQTGPKAVAPQWEWIASLIEQCDAAGVPCWIKDNVGWPDTVRGLPSGD